jgi:hypothetical protein
MAATRLIFGFAFVAVVITALFLGLNVQSKAASLDEAESLSRTVRSYLQQIDADCRARPGEYAELQDCLDKVSEELEAVGEMKLEEFENAEEDAGYIILTNEGRQSLVSANFTLLLNRDVVDEGCTVEGDIDPGSACRMDFSQECTAGDNLEVTYNGERAYLRTC